MRNRTIIPCLSGSLLFTDQRTPNVGSPLCPTLYTNSKHSSLYVVVRLKFVVTQYFFYIVLLQKGFCKLDSGITSRTCTTLNSSWTIRLPSRSSLSPYSNVTSLSGHTDLSSFVSLSNSST